MQPDSTARIPLRARDGSIRAYALIDAADAEWANRYRWSLSNAGYTVRNVKEHGRTRQYSLHRELLGLGKGDGRECDHINRDKLDDRRANLRVLVRGQNPQNRPSQRTSTSAYRGVCWNTKVGKWMAYVRPNNRFVFCGHFVNETDAAEAAREARARLMPYAVD